MQMIPTYLCFSISLSLCIHPSLSLDLFLPDDVTALTCPLGASYLGYLRKYRRLLHCSQEAEILNQLLMLNPSRSLFFFPFVSTPTVCVLYNNLCVFLPCVCVCGMLPVMAERSASLVKMFFIPRSCRVLLRSIFCSTLNLNSAVRV